MTVALVDDQLLGSVLRGRTPPALRRFDLATTGSWYVRLCQAVLGAAEQHGVLSAPFSELPDGLRERALVAVVELPDDIALISLRDLAPDIGRLRRRHRLNILRMEALASAIRLEAEVVLSTSSPHLEAALMTEGRRSRVLR